MASNNISERGRPAHDPAEDLRPPHPEDASQDRLDIRGYIDTAREHGREALTILRSLMTGSTWGCPSQSAPENARETSHSNSASGRYIHATG
jgi:hypothetical protein